MLSEWLAWRERETEELRAERREMGLPEDPEAEKAAEDEADKKEDAVVEEIMEEILDETEEVMP